MDKEWKTEEQNICMKRKGEERGGEGRILIKMEEERVKKRGKGISRIKRRRGKIDKEGDEDGGG